MFCLATSSKLGLQNRKSIPWLGFFWKSCTSLAVFSCCRLGL